MEDPPLIAALAYITFTEERDNKTVERERERTKRES